MVRLIILAVLAIGIFTQIPDLATKWLVSNGYMEGDYGQSEALSAKIEEPQKTVKRSGRTVLQANRHGHFLAQAHINNRSIRIVIDTGATFVALSYEDAKRLGLKPKPSDFKIPVSTANGRVHFAKTTLRKIRIGRVEEFHIKALIAPKGALDITLMGMSYLKKLKNFQVTRGKLILEG